MISSGPIEDRLAIREESYNDAVMRFDGEAWAANWTDDAIWSLQDDYVKQDGRWYFRKRVYSILNAEASE